MSWDAMELEFFVYCWNRMGRYSDWDLKYFESLIDRGIKEKNF